jgi:hypothetical protein
MIVMQQREAPPERLEGQLRPLVKNAYIIFGS